MLYCSRGSREPTQYHTPQGEPFSVAHNAPSADSGGRLGVLREVLAIKYAEPYG